MSGLGYSAIALKPVTGIIQPHLGITKPTEGLNMPWLRDEFGTRYKYFTTQVTGKTCAKAVGILYRGEKPRTSVLQDKYMYYLTIAFNEPFHTVERFEEVAVDNTLRDRQNSSYPTKAEFNNCFIIYSKYFPVFKGGFAISLFVLSFTHI